jgi:proteasome lid subunit RPN8/RPN11
MPGVADPLAEPILRLTHLQYDTVLAHCFDGFPEEACGVLTGPYVDGYPTGEVAGVYPCRNADASARTYTVDSLDLLGAMREAEERGHEVIGVWHSHTHTDAYPSATDVRQAVDPTWCYVIVSLKSGEPVLRGYFIRDGLITECPVAVG